MQPRTALTRKPPAALVGHKTAIATWKWAIGLYSEVEGRIATAFDENLLIRYCLAYEQYFHDQNLLKEITEDYRKMLKVVQKIKSNPENYGNIAKLWTQVNAIGQRMQGMDGRLDNKSKMLHSMEQSLYLTPRARAGVEPPMKEPEQPKSEMEKVLDE